MKKQLAALIVISLLALSLGGAHAASTTSTAMSPAGTTGLPDAYSWRNVDGTDYTTGVKNQEPCPSCEAYALCAAMETMMQYQRGELFTPDLSEMHLFFCAGGTCEWGVNVSDAADYLVEHGVPDEGCYPDPHRRGDQPCNDTLPGWQNRTVKITDWGWVPRDEAAIKQALIEHGPLTICIWVYKDFMYYTGGVYEHRWGRLDGGHLVTLTGYDDSREAWLVKNSWGKSWGDGGWFWMGYDMDMFIPGCYGGTGILYIDHVYGTFQPDVPRVYIERPRRYHSYILGHEIPSIFGRAVLQIGMPRVFGHTTVTVDGDNTERVEFYLDGMPRYTDSRAPFSWRLDVLPGRHTVEVYAYSDSGNVSRDIVDVFVVV